MKHKCHYTLTLVNVCIKYKISTHRSPMIFILFVVKQDFPPEKKKGLAFY